jgi:hypothetical protein
VSNAAETAAGELNGTLACILAGHYRTKIEAQASVDEIVRSSAAMGARMPRVHAAMTTELHETLRDAFLHGAPGAAVDPKVAPRLIRCWKDFNIVSYRGRFSAIPHAAGPLDLTERDPNTIEGAIVRESYANLRLSLDRTEQGAGIAAVGTMGGS